MQWADIGEYLIRYIANVGHGKDIINDCKWLSSIAWPSIRTNILMIMPIIDEHPRRHDNHWWGCLFRVQWTGIKEHPEDNFAKVTLSSSLTTIGNETFLGCTWGQGRWYFQKAWPSLIRVTYMDFVWNITIDCCKGDEKLACGKLVHHKGALACWRLARVNDWLQWHFCKPCRLVLMPFHLVCKIG